MAVIVFEDCTVPDVPPLFVAVANALNIFAGDAASVDVMVYDVELEPLLDATLVLEAVGVPDVVVVIKTSYDVGDPDHPDVDAVIVLPAVLFPDKVTDPPEGADTGLFTDALGLT